MVTTGMVEIFEGLVIDEFCVIGFGKSNQKAVWAATEAIIISQTGFFQPNLRDCGDRECQNFRFSEISGSDNDGVRISDIDLVDI